MSYGSPQGETPLAVADGFNGRLVILRSGAVLGPLPKRFGSRGNSVLATLTSPGVTFLPMGQITQVVIRQASRLTHGAILLGTLDTPAPTARLAAVVMHPHVIQFDRKQQKGFIAAKALIDQLRATALSQASSGTPNWYPDPHQRHQLRYWDGARWTEHVSDNGTPTVDSVS